VGVIQALAQYRAQRRIGAFETTRFHPPESGLVETLEHTNTRRARSRRPEGSRAENHSPDIGERLRKTLAVSGPRRERTRPYTVERSHGCRARVAPKIALRLRRLRPAPATSFRHWDLRLSPAK